MSSKSVFNLHLEIAHVREGSVQRAARRVRVTANFRCPDDAHMAAQSRACGGIKAAQLFTLQQIATTDSTRRRLPG